MSIIFAENGNSAPQADIIASNAFWPNVSIAAYRATMSVDQSVTDARVKSALIFAIATANQELKPLRLQAISQGISALADCDADTIDGESSNTQSYRRAVYCFAHVEILEKYATYAATGNTADRAEAKQEQADDFRCMAHAAIADILGTARNDCELI